MGLHPHCADIVARLEAMVVGIAGPLQMQTDFRRDARGAADATILVRAHVDSKLGSELCAAMERCDAIEAVRFNRQKLTVRFTDRFMAERINWLLSSRTDGDLARKPLAGRKILVDFCDPNANKALHVGHLRNIALGASIAALWEACGASVERQSVVCDIGRNVAEALAGLVAAGDDVQTIGGAPLSRRLGLLYADYVGSQACNVAQSAEADAPIARELSRHDDLAETLLDRWRNGDPEILALWRAVIERVLAEQSDTLDHLGIRFSRILRESDAIADADRVARMLVRHAGAFVDGAGAVVLNTGRPDYARCPLTRSDGFPTEHLRALVLWERLRIETEQPDRIIHVMGQEWRTSTDIRIEALERLRPSDFPARYQMLAHRLVRLNGSDMKSSSGDVILIDDLLLAIGARLQGLGLTWLPCSASLFRRLAALAPMIEAEPEKQMDVSLEMFLDPDQNCGLRIARALSVVVSGKHDAPLNDHTRYLALQAERMKRMIETAAVQSRPDLVLAHIIRLSDERLSNSTGKGDAILTRLLLAGLEALGWYGKAAETEFPRP